VGNPVVQWQIVAKAPGALTRFCASLFGWKVQTNNALGHREVDTQKRAACGKRENPDLTPYRYGAVQPRPSRVLSVGTYSHPIQPV
jgi:hypothetical protein